MAFMRRTAHGHMEVLTNKSGIKRGKRAEEAIHLPGRDTSTGLFCVRIKSGVLCAIVWKCVIDRK